MKKYIPYIPAAIFVAEFFMCAHMTVHMIQKNEVPFSNQIIALFATMGIGILAGIAIYEGARK